MLCLTTNNFYVSKKSGNIMKENNLFPAASRKVLRIKDVLGIIVSWDTY